jgi:hypothetical protein
MMIKCVKYAYFVSENNEILGKYDDQRLKEAKLYQKMLSKISKKYKNRFIDCKPIKVNIKITHYE